VVSKLHKTKIKFDELTTFMRGVNGIDIPDKQQKRYAQLAKSFLLALRKELRADCPVRIHAIHQSSTQIEGDMQLHVMGKDSGVSVKILINSAGKGIMHRAITDMPTQGLIIYDSNPGVITPPDGDFDGFITTIKTLIK
jgi:hypothetical protein